MKVTRNRLLRNVVLALLSAGLMSTLSKAGPREEGSAILGGLTAAPETSQPLANGVYFVLRDGLTREEVRIDKVPHIVLVYDRKYSEEDKNEPPRYVALDTSTFVPLVLAGTPETRKDDRGWTLLDVTLAPEYIKALEEFTRAHLGGRVAIVIDREIITMHKVRSVIKDGRAQVTRCNDHACKVLLLKLAK